ncbi:MAG: LexA family transcriptional regulator [Tannerellaceae bacterium]|jgi:phage repressor protein C with HTH and peptisase S24 domain/DNA-binding XRE family transcriptional regulator|nr:LexA family transcriptional regulator [Tannerellaceae bacterium]
MFDLKKFRADLKLKQSDLEVVLEVTQGFLSRIENGKDSFPEKYLPLLEKKYGQDIIEKYIINDSSKVSDYKEIQSVYEQAHKGLYGVNNTNAAHQNDLYRLVPQYNMDARGGFGANEEVDTKEYITGYIPFKDAKESDICIPVSGNSMLPVYAPGTVILLHKIETWREFLELGQVYVIILNDGRRLLKELKKGTEKGYFLCISYNPSFDPVELPKDLISGVFLVTAIYQKTTI